MIQRLSLALVLLSVPAWGASLDEAQTAWADSWADKPALVTLGDLGALDGTSSEIENRLKERLRGLSRKTFSNREWKAYWTRQNASAKTFTAALTQANQTLFAQSLGSWAQLASDKMANQDVYLAAIEMERDAVEKRLEASVTEASQKSNSNPAEAAELSPFQQRQAMIEGLEHELDMQERRTLRAEQALAMIESQKQAASRLLKAVQKDVELARVETNLAAQQAGSEDAAWALLWSPIAKASAEKAQKIKKESQLTRVRIRGLDIEATLANSQIAYRMAKILELKSDIEASSSLEGWSDAITATAKRWLSESLWKVLLSLLGIWLLLRLALRVIGRLSNALQHVADDGDDEHTSQSEQRAGTIAAVFGGIAKVTAYAVAILTALEVIGVNTGPIVGSVAILGLAVSFGSQNLVKDVVNGFFILIENQFAVGDVVTIGGNTGTVEKINLRSTRIRQYDGTLHVIPNGSIDSVANRTRDWARVVLTVGVGYDSNLQMVEDVVNSVGQTLFDDPNFEGQMDEPAVYLGVVELADSSVNVRCIVRTVPGAQWAVSRELQRRIKDAFDEAGIEIPFPQRVMRSV
jgi:small conductance mechanosensitive channel